MKKVPLRLEVNSQMGTEVNLPKNWEPQQRRVEIQISAEVRSNQLRGIISKNNQCRKLLHLEKFLWPKKFWESTTWWQRSPERLHLNLLEKKPRLKSTLFVSNEKMTQKMKEIRFSLPNETFKMKSLQSLMKEYRKWKSFSSRLLPTWG